MKEIFRARAWIAVGLAAVVVLAGVLLFPPKTQTPAQSLDVIGDVAKALSITDGGGFKTEQFAYKGNTFAGIPLSDILAKVQPLAKSNSILFMTKDSLMAEIASDDLAGCYIIAPEDGKNGWEAVNTRHPVLSNMKQISSIAVVSNDLETDNALNIVSDSQLLFTLTPGNLLKRGYAVGVKTGGTSKMESDGKTLTATQYNVYKYVSLASLAGEAGQKISNVLVVGEEGGYAYDAAPGVIKIEKNSLTYMFSDRKTEMKNARGILINPPQKSNTDVKEDALKALKQNKKVLIVILDGFGYGQYEDALKQGLIPFIGSLGEAQKASTVFIPVTNAGMAAILTGEGPDKNGVWFRQKDLKAEDIFKAATALGKKSVYVEGDKLIVKTSGTPVLNSDRNGDGNTDDEIFACIRDAMSKDEADLYAVHFHAIDDAGHAGDAQKMTKVIASSDTYVKALASGFDGCVIIVADHGVHDEGSGKNHGEFLPQDMIIPYILWDGGK
ncbi:MAG: alkaline phosphatase family protein [Bacillota bacterium]